MASLNKQHTAIIPPAQLWVGQHETVVPQVIAYLQKELCQQGTCHVCTTCMQLREQQHHSVTWLYPEKMYTLDYLKKELRMISFALATNEHHFFIIQKADFLTTQCANSLLKSIEEPPAGYHFILLTQRLAEIVPTIKSRCTIRTFTTTHATTNSKLLSFFTSVTPADPFLFLKELDAAKPNERETEELLDALLIFWTTQTKQALINDQTAAYTKAHTIVTTIKQNYKKIPMPGSSKLFLKELFIQIC